MRGKFEIRKLKYEIRNLKDGCYEYLVRERDIMHFRFNV